MSTLENIKNYILREKKLGRLKPGDQIPPYRELMKKLGGSCATVQSAMKKLDAEGLVEIKRGTGVYLAGASPLKIKFFVQPSNLDMSVLREMIMRRVKEQNLYLDVEVLNCDLIRDRKNCDYKHLGGDEKVYVVETKPEEIFNISGLANLQNFEGFSDIADDLIDTPVADNTISLPFYIINYQIGLNLRLLAKADVDPNVISGYDLSWHEEVFKKCRSRSVVPASSYWSAYDSWWINNPLNYILTSMLINEKGSLPPYYEKPVFNTESGRKAFKILSDHDMFEDRTDKGKHFMHGGSAISFAEGSWFAVHCKERSAEPLENFRFIPYCANGRKINFLKLVCLQTYLSPNLTPDEKLRVMAFLRVIVSKDFQKEYCAKTGFLSARRNMDASDYPWSGRPDFEAFVPAADDINVWSGEMAFRRDGNIVAALFDQHRLHGIDIGATLKYLDEKIIMPEERQF